MEKLLFSVLMLFGALALHAQNDPVGLDINAIAPDFTAIDQDGQKISLKDQLEKGPVVLVFYRGQWCPYCNRHLKQLEDSLAMIKSKGATLIAVTPETTENISRTIEKTKASYPIIHDEGLKIMKSYGVSFGVDAKTVEKYKEYGLDFTKINGSSNGANLPIPAVYVINKKRKISFRHFDKNYVNRASVSEILRLL